LNALNDKACAIDRAAEINTSFVSAEGIYLHVFTKFMGSRRFRDLLIISLQQPAKATPETAIFIYFHPFSTIVTGWAQTRKTFKIEPYERWRREIGSARRILPPLSK